VFFLLPFPLEPASSGPAHHKALPLLPVPGGRRREGPAAETAFADAIAQAGYVAAGLLRCALISITSSLTALGNQANLLFAQATAALAFDRMMRQAAALPGMGWAAPAAPYFPQQIWAAWLWHAPFQPPMWSAPAAIPAWPANLWGNAWPAWTEAFTFWAKIWEPAMGQRNPVSVALGGQPPFTATLSLPGCSWSVTLR
jgi:hypothetical protein